MRHLHCGGGKRHHSGLYAQSKDGLVWDKPELDSGITYLAGTVPLRRRTATFQTKMSSLKGITVLLLYQLIL